jgi:hypothetical protein
VARSNATCSSLKCTESNGPYSYINPNPRLRVYAYYRCRASTVKWFKLSLLLRAIIKYIKMFKVQVYMKQLRVDRALGWAWLILEACQTHDIHLTSTHTIRRVRQRKRENWPHRSRQRLRGRILGQIRKPWRRRTNVLLKYTYSIYQFTT